jgi:hypothetical protein
LKDLVLKGSSVTLSYFRGIDDNGDILVNGTENNGQIWAYLLVPKKQGP